MKNCEIEYYMDLAVCEAKKAFEKNEVPCGAVIVKNEEVIGQGANQVEEKKDPICHAEILALKDAVGNTDYMRLDGAYLFTTVEPCIMCAGAIIHARIEKVYYGCKDYKWGGFGTLYDFSEDKRLNHCVEVKGGIKEKECRFLMSKFFKKLR